MVLRDYLRFQWGQFSQEYLLKPHFGGLSAIMVIVAVCFGQSLQNWILVGLISYPVTSLVLHLFKAHSCYQLGGLAWHAQGKPTACFPSLWLYLRRAKHVDVLSRDLTLFSSPEASTTLASLLAQKDPQQVRVLVSRWGSTLWSAFSAQGLRTLRPTPPTAQQAQERDQEQEKEEKGEGEEGEKRQRLPPPLPVLVRDQLALRPCLVRCDDQVWVWIGESEVDRSCQLVNLKRVCWPPRADGQDFFGMELETLERCFAEEGMVQECADRECQ